MHRHFEDELETLRTLIIRMGSLVDEQIELAFRALQESDLELADRVIDRERRVNEYDLMIEGQCQRIFALTQPVAVDLRLMMAAMRMNSDLERIGDIAVNLAERVAPLRLADPLLKEIKAFDNMKLARQMLSDAFDAFINNDANLARTVFDKDDEVDDFARDAFYKLIEVMKQDVDKIEPAAHTMALLRHVERLADHATNIAEDVIFIVEAKLMKHKALTEGGQGIDIRAALSRERGEPI